MVVSSASRWDNCSLSCTLHFPEKGGSDAVVGANIRFWPSFHIHSSRQHHHCHHKSSKL